MSLGGESDPDPTTLAFDLRFAGFVSLFFPSNPTYRDLISTGNLGLISDIEMGHAVVGYYEEVTRIEQFYEQWAVLARQHRPTVTALLAPPDYAAVVQSFGRERGRDSTIMTPVQLNVSRTLRSLSEEPSLLNTLLDAIEAAEQQQGSFNALKTRAVELLRLIEGQAQ